MNFLLISRQAYLTGSSGPSSHAPELCPQHTKSVIWKVTAEKSRPTGESQNLEKSKLKPFILLSSGASKCNKTFYSGPRWDSLSLSLSDFIAGGKNPTIPQSFTVTSNIYAFTFYFFCFTIFSCRLRAVD